MSQPISALRSTMVVSLARLVSATLALILGVLSARYFGTSMAKDCYVVAQAIPSLAVTILVGGIWGTLLVTLAEVGKEEGLRGQWRFARRTLAHLALILVPLSLAVALAPEPLVRLAAPGFRTEQLALASNLLRVSLWIVTGNVVFIVIRCLFETRQNFIVPTSVYMVPPAVSLIALWALVGRAGIFSLAIGPILGLACAIALIIILANRLKDPPGFVPLPHAPHREAERRRTFWTAFLPMSLGANCGQINLLVDNAFASYLPTGSITMLGFAYVIVANTEQLSILSLSEVAFPRLITAGLAASDELARTLRTTLRFMLLLSAPLAAGLAMFGLPIARLLFEHGEFLPPSTLAVARLLAVFSLEVIFMGCALLLSRVLIARKRFLTLGAVSLGAILANAFLDRALMTVMGVEGLALATTLVAFAQCVALVPLVRRETGPILDAGLGGVTVKVLGGALVMGLAVTLWRILYENLLGTSGNLVRLLLVVSGIALGACVYGTLVYALRVEEARDLLRRGVAWLRAATGA